MTKYEFKIDSKHSKYQMLMDATVPVKTSRQIMPVLFIHGFKGFKDWGVFNLMAEFFAKQGLALFKANLSHNGTRPDFPSDFVNLEAFSKNTFSIEMADIQCQIDFLQSLSHRNEFKNIHWEKLAIIGHSRGGGIALLQAVKDNRIRKLVTWAGISDFAYAWTPEFIKTWKKDGSFVIPNSRTGQNMPMHIDIYHDFMANRQAFDILQKASELEKPHLILHGEKDETLSLQMAYDLHKANPAAELCIINDANHTFGATHPWPGALLPPHFKKLVDETITFIQK